MVGLFLAYKAGRLLVDGRVSDAFANAGLVWHVERALRLPDEAGFQQLLLGSDGLIRAANIYYAVVHFPATVAFLLFMYFFRPEHYVRFRRMLAWLTAMGLVIHFAFPLAPPRMLGGLGLVDTAAAYGPSVYGPPQTDTLSNQYAAMPSLHVGWAIVVAAGLIVATRSRWRWLWAVHPLLTTIVVVGTANHYWIDGLVIGALVAGLLTATAKHTTAVPEIPINEEALINAGAVVGAGGALRTETAINAGTTTAPPSDSTIDEPAVVVAAHEGAIRAVPLQVPHIVNTEPAGEPAR
ncbi:hypothetical protein GCM10010199_51290 [Dactylosporangium roseum]